MKRPFRAAVGDPSTLVALLASRLAMNFERAASLVRDGRVELRGKRAPTDCAIATGDRVLVFLPDDDLAVEPLVVVHRDEEVIVIDKPAGMRTQAVRGDAATDLIDRVQRELDPRATLLHRLDRDTSGLVLLPTSNRARFRLQRALDAGKVDRRYLARVHGRIDTPREVMLRIARDPSDARRRVALPEEDPNGEAARTHVEVLQAGEQTLVRLVLDTGRTHQLRVHLAAIGHPIVGDRLYGGPPHERLLLHADELTFPDIATGKPLSVRSEPPIELRSPP